MDAAHRRPNRLKEKYKSSNLLNEIKPEDREDRKSRCWRV